MLSSLNRAGMRRSFRLDKLILWLFKWFYLPQRYAVYIIYSAVIEPKKRGLCCGNSDLKGGLSTILVMLYFDTFF